MARVKREARVAAADLVDLIEAAYDLELDDRAWLANVLGRAAPHLDVGRGVFAFYFDASDREHVRFWYPVDVGNTTLPIKMRLARHVIAGSESRTIAYVACGPTTVGSLSAVLAEGDLTERARPWIALSGHRDYLGIRACDPSLCGVAFAVCHREPFTPPVATRRLWTRLAAHIAAGQRLRRSLRIANVDPLLDDGDAVLSADGKLHDATGAATDAEARERLRSAVVDMDRARGRERARDVEHAIRLWRGLVDGTWSLVERFESDGRRYLVARRNPPGMLDPRGLTLREKQVVSFAALGHSNKLIAYELGVQKSTVTTHLTSAMRKLGIDHQVTLVQLLRMVTDAASNAESPA